MFVPIRLSHPPLQFLLTEYRYDLYPLRYESGCWISVAPKPMHNLSIGINSFYKIIRSPKPFGHTISPRWDNLTRSEQIPAIPSTLTFTIVSIIGIELNWIRKLATTNTAKPGATLYWLPYPIHEVDPKDLTQTNTLQEKKSPKRKRVILVPYYWLRYL